MFEILANSVVFDGNIGQLILMGYVLYLFCPD